MIVNYYNSDFFHLYFIYWFLVNDPAAGGIHFSWIKLPVSFETRLWFILY